MDDTKQNDAIKTARSNTGQKITGDSSDSARLVTIGKLASAPLERPPSKSLTSTVNENYQNPGRVQRIKLLAAARDVTLGHGVTGCLLHPINFAETVDVAYGDERRSATIRNVMTCKSVWACPVCADRITRFRAALLMRGMDEWAKQGHTASLATYTIQHNISEGCTTVLKRLQAGYKRFKGDRAYKRLAANHAVAGSVRALEMTIGEAGFHWHVHEVFFLTGEQSTRFLPMLHDLRGHWLTSVRNAGGYATAAHGFHLDEERRAAFDYVAKFGKGEQKRETWNAARETVRSPAKSMSDDRAGMHPFKLLETARQISADRGRWNEYVKSTKGVLQLRYATGTKAMLGLPANEDDAAAAFEPDETERILARITPSGWYGLNLKSPEALGEFYAVADAGDAELLEAWLESNDVPMRPAAKGGRDVVLA